MRSRPERRLHFVRTGPGRIGLHHTGPGQGQVIVIGSDRAPDDRLGHSPLDVIAIIRFGQGAGAAPGPFPWTIFARPKRLATAASRRCALIFWVMHTHYLD